MSLQSVASLIDNSSGVIYDHNVFYSTGHWLPRWGEFFRLEIDTNCSSRKKKTFFGGITFVHVDNPVKLFTAVIFYFL